MIGLLSGVADGRFGCASAGRRVSEGRGRWGSGWGLGAVSEGVGWVKWARLVLRAVFSTRWGQLRKEAGRRGLNVSVGRVRRGRAKAGGVASEGGIRDRDLCEERHPRGSAREEPGLRICGRKRESCVRSGGSSGAGQGGEVCVRKGGMESTRERIARGRGCCREEGTLEKASVRTERIVGILGGESLSVRYRYVTKFSDDSAGFEGCLMLENDGVRED